MYDDTTTALLFIFNCCVHDKDAQLRFKSDIQFGPYFAVAYNETLQLPKYAGLQCTMGDTLQYMTDHQVVDPTEYAARVVAQYDIQKGYCELNANITECIHAIDHALAPGPYPNYISGMTLNDIQSSINMCDVQQASLNSTINACCANTEHFFTNNCEYFVLEGVKDTEDNLDEGPIGLTIIDCEKEDKTEKSASSRARFIIIFIAGVILGVGLAVIDYIINGGIL